MDTDVQPSPSTSVLDATSLATLAERDFYREVGAINTAYETAAAAFRDAQENLTVLLTEQVARHLLKIHADAAMLFVRVAAEYHSDDDNVRNPDCTGHNHRLVPFEVMDENGIVIGGFDPYSPVMFLMERLSPLLGLEDQVLDIETREWALDCTDD